MSDFDQVWGKLPGLMRICISYSHAFYVAVPFKKCFTVDRILILIELINLQIYFYLCDAILKWPQSTICEEKKYMYHLLC